MLWLENSNCSVLYSFSQLSDPRETSAFISSNKTIVVGKIIILRASIFCCYNIRKISIFLHVVLVITFYRYVVMKVLCRSCVCVFVRNITRSYGR